MEELKPCPFCGSTPLLSAGPYDWDGGGRYYYYSAAIECACGLTLEVDNPRPREYTNYTKALDFSIAAWNKRAERTCLMEYNEDWSGDELYPTEAYQCSVCGGITQEGRPHYCPKCGAKVVDE